MKYYNILFAGLIHLGRRTTYSEIAGYVAAWGMAMIIELNIMLIAALIQPGSFFSQTYVLLITYILLVFLNVKYYHRCSDAIKNSGGGASTGVQLDLVFSEKVALFFLVESIVAPMIVAMTK